MSSGIPTFSAKKLPTTQSRLAAPSTLRKPSSLIQGTQRTFSTTKGTRLSGIKRPSDSVFSSQTKFKRTTPLSLIRNNGPKALASTQASARLDFKTPTTNRNVHIMTADNTENVKSLNVQEQKPVTTESKSTSPIVGWNSLTKDTEINSYKCKISLLEKQIDEMNLKNSKIRIENEVKETRTKSELDANRKVIEKLNDEVLMHKEDEIKLKNEYDLLKNDSLEQTNLFEKQQIEYEKTINELRNKLSESISNENDTRSSLSSENLNLKFRIDELENELERSKSEILIYNRNFEEFKLKENNIERLNRELNVANIEIKRLNDELKDYKEAAQLKNILKDEINQYQQIQEENNQLKNQLDLLKDVHEQNLINNEKLLSRDTEIEELKKIINQKNLDLGELNYSKKRINEWIKIVGVDSPDIVVNSIEELKQNMSFLRLENDSLKAQINSQNTSDLLQDASSKSLAFDLKEANQKIHQLNEELKKSNRKRLLFSKEKEHYKQALNSYESEITVNFDDAFKNRIADLEKIISEYEEIQEKQELELKKAIDQSKSIVAKEKEILELNCEIERIKTLNPHIYTNMSLNVSTLQTNEKNFRVIHLKENPLTIKINEYAKEYNNLKAENYRLKTIVEILESGNVADMTRQIDEGIKNRSELEILKKKLAVKESKYNTLSDRFKKISKSFRETCFYLTGYKIDNIANNRYKLTHAYDSQNRALIFEVNNKVITMLQESSLSSLQDKIDTYLTGGDSYPAFLAAFTLELYQNKNNLSRSSFFT